MKGKKTAVDVLPHDLSDIQATFDIGPGVVLPIQVTQSIEIPELAIFRAMIEDAVWEARMNQERGVSRERAYRRYWAQRRALGWIFSRGEDWFSFEFCCEWTGMDANRIRKHILFEVPAAQEIDEHLRDPDKVPPPEIPQEFIPRATNRRWCMAQKVGQKELFTERP